LGKCENRTEIGMLLMIGWQSLRLIDRRRDDGTKKRNRDSGKREDRGRVVPTVRAMPRMVPQGYARAGKSHMGDEKSKEKVVGTTSIVTLPSI
jgi:hypothetical protein